MRVLILELWRIECYINYRIYLCRWYHNWVMIRGVSLLVHTISIPILIHISSGTLISFMIWHRIRRITSLRLCSISIRLSFMNFLIYLSYAICRSSKVSSTHVYSSTINMSYLNLRNKFKSYFLIKEFNKTEASTWLGHRITDDLGILYLSKLFEMLSKHLITKLIIKATYENLVTNRIVPIVLQFA